MMMFRKIAIAAIAAISLWSSEALADCNGQFTPGQVCGVSGSGQAPPSASLLSSLLDRNFGAPSPQGTILNRGASLWSATRSPVLGNPGTNTGTLGLASASGGTATITPAAIAGNTAFQWPTLSGTIPSTATGPIVLNATTGAISCPTCTTGTGGALTAGVTTTSGFTAGQILYSDGTLLQAAGAVKATSIALGGATIGSDGLGVTGSATISGNVLGGAFVPTSSSIPTDGMYLNSAGQTAFSAGSTRIFFFNSTGLLMANASGATLSSAAATATAPTMIPRRSDSGTGMGSSGTGSLSLIATSVEQLRINNGSIYVGGAATGSNIAAVAPTISAALSTGTATNPDLVFQTGVATTSGAGQATATAALTIKGETQAMIATGTLAIKSGTAIPVGGTTGAGYLFSSTTNFGAFFGSGVPSLSAAQGSIYIRSDGVPYYNTNGTTGWAVIGGSSVSITSLTGDVTGTGPGATATTVAKIQGTVVAGTTGSSNVVFSNAPTIVGGSVTALTALSVASTGAARNVIFASNDPTLTADHTLNITLNNGNRGLNLAGDVVIGSAFQTVGGQPQVWNRTSDVSTTTIIPSGTHTLAGLDVSQAFSGNNSFAGTSLFTGSVPSLSNGNAAIAASSTAGGIFTGKGSISDITIQNGAGAVVGSVATGTQTLNLDTLTLTNRLGSAYMALGTNAASGAVQCDGTSINCAAGVISAAAIEAAGISEAWNGEYLIWSLGTTFSGVTTGIQTADTTINGPGVGGTFAVSQVALANSVINQIQATLPAGSNRPRYEKNLNWSVAPTGGEGRAGYPNYFAMEEMTLPQPKGQAGKQITISAVIWTNAGTIVPNTYIYADQGVGAGGANGCTGNTISGTGAGVDCNSGPTEIISRSAAFSINSTPTLYTFTVTLNNLNAATFGTQPGFIIGLGADYNVIGASQQINFTALKYDYAASALPWFRLPDATVQGTAFGATQLPGTGGCIPPVNNILYMSGTLISCGILPVSSAVLVYDASGKPVASGGLAAGQLIIGQAGATPIPVSLSGAITLAASGVTTLVTAQPAVHTWALAQTFTVAPVFTDQSGSRTALGLGTAATQATGTSGATLGFLNGNNTNSGTNNFTGTFQINGNAQTFPGAAATLTQTVASGATALGTGAISSAACATVVTATATGTLTTDAIAASFNGDPTAVTGYIPSTSGMLTIFVYPTANTFNAKVCNNTALSITPGAITLNWRVTR